MKLDCLLDELQYFVLCLCRRDAPQKIRYVCTEAARTLLDNDHVSHVTRLLETSLFQNATERAGRDINTGFTRHRPGSRARSVFQDGAGARLASIMRCTSMRQPPH